MIMVALYIALALLGCVIVFYVIPNVFVAVALYNILLVRTKKTKWARGCSWDDEEQQCMFDTGKEWGAKNEEYHSTLTVKSGKFRLVGEYFDFGNDKAVIMVPGRMEMCEYSYYFAEPYKKSGYNVLAIDNRSHGLSDGKFDDLGLKEYKDLLAWAKKLHDEYGIKKIWFHGMCIGAATCLYACTAENAPDYIQGMTNEGMFIHFGDMLEKRIAERNHKVHPCLDIVIGLITVVSGRNPVKHGPVNYIEKMNKPMLFMYSKKDVYSDPEKINGMYEKCPAVKQIKWFNEGIHSHIRINQTEEYDKTIEDFLAENA